MLGVRHGGRVFQGSDLSNHPRAAKKRAKTFDRVGNNFVAHITWLLAF